MRAAELDNLVRRVIAHDPRHGDHVRTAQAHGLVERESVKRGGAHALLRLLRQQRELRRRGRRRLLFSEVGSLDEDLARQRNVARASRLVLRKLGEGEPLGHALRVVRLGALAQRLNHDAQRAKDAHRARSNIVELFARDRFEHRDIDDRVVGAREADRGAESAYRGGRNAAPTEAWGIVKDVRGSESNCEHDSRKM